MKLPYSEGSVFLVPLRDSGYARGVVARSGPQGKVLFGYFFGPRLPAQKRVEVSDLDPGKAIFRGRFGDLGLINGEWTILGRVPRWTRSLWRIPELVRWDARGPGRHMLVRYSDVDPQRVEAQCPIDDDPGLATTAMYGYGAIEIELTKRLRSNADHPQ
jgi:hypothetical protein